MTGAKERARALFRVNAMPEVGGWEPVACIGEYDFVMRCCDSAKEAEALIAERSTKIVAAIEAAEEARNAAWFAVVENLFGSEVAHRCELEAAAAVLEAKA